MSLSIIKETGTIEAKLTYAVPQSEIDSGKGTLYYINGTQTLSMTDAHRSFITNKNISLFPHISSSQTTYSSTAASVAY